ncbi:hypothetical protein [Lelliottia sp.]|uniref:hypothetical protein n=1 Tax=Lelliottia sp. TaxID=1898429 RepID=UPI00388F181B
MEKTLNECVQHEASFYFALPALIISTVTPLAQASDNGETIKSLDSITAQSSEIPAILFAAPAAPPESSAIPEERHHKTPAKKIARLRLHTPQSPQNTANAELSALKSEQEKAIAELKAKYTSEQTASEKAIADAQKALADSENSAAR